VEVRRVPCVLSLSRARTRLSVSFSLAAAVAAVVRASSSLRVFVVAVCFSLADLHPCLSRRAPPCTDPTVFTM